MQTRPGHPGGFRKAISAALLGKPAGWVGSHWAGMNGLPSPGKSASRRPRMSPGEAGFVGEGGSGVYQATQQSYRVTNLPGVPGIWGVYWNTDLSVLKPRRVGYPS